MVSEKGLIEVLIPEDKDTPINYRDGPKSDIYMSADFLPDFKGPVKESALILIQGTGSVRPGVWARSVCLNENLEKGSMLPLIDAAQRNNMSVLVMNPNLRVDPITRAPIKFC